jgi:ubiquinone/menaquinone biosynthesis C-methylase UbiE
MNEKLPIENAEIERQRKNVAELYEHAAPVYDESFDGKAEYQIPLKLIETYRRHGITGGEILDIGCGTGKLREYLGDGFTYKGIDLSPAMIELAEKRGFDGFVGPVEDVIATFEDKSVDHITALASLNFVKDWENLAKEFERVARKSIFVSLEQFSPEIITMMKARGIDIYNHSADDISDPKEVTKNIFLWIRPTVDERVEIFGDLVFKQLS